MLDTSARLLRLLTTLQTRRHWAGPDLSEKLGVTARTLRRDVEKLRSLGYAIQASSGPGGGYQLGSGASLPPLLLSDDEAIALAVSLRSAADTFTGVGETVVSVLVKLEQLLPQRLRRRASALQAMTVSVGRRSDLDPDVLIALATACRDGVELRFEYTKHDGTTSHRHVEPLRLAHTGNHRWYLVAWDVDGGGWRTFRIDRVQAPELGPTFVPRQPPEDLERYVSESITSRPYRRQARLRLFGSADDMRSRVPPWIGIIEADDDESCVLALGANSLDELTSLIVLAGVDFEVLEPHELGEHLRHVARRLMV